MAGNTDTVEDTTERKKKTDKAEKKRKSNKSTDDSSPTGSHQAKNGSKKRSKTMSPKKLKQELKQHKSEKGKMRKSVGGSESQISISEENRGKVRKSSVVLGRIKLGPSKKSPQIIKKKASSPKTQSKPSTQGRNSPITVTPSTKSVAAKKSTLPAVSSKSRKGLDPDAIPIEPICFEEGAKIEAVDHGIWYKARIVKVDKDKMDILVHFDGWGARFDTWFPMTSALIRGRTQLENKADMQKYATGEDVLARWTDGNFYPATVLSVKESGSCLVMYFDGMKKLIRPNVIKKMSEKEKEASMKAVAKLLLMPPKEATSPLSPLSAGSPSSTDGTSFRKYKTSANDRERRLAARGAPKIQKEEATGKRAKKRRASQITTDTETILPTSLPSARTSRNSSDDESFIAKKARLDKITHNLLDRVSPTSESDKKKKIEADNDKGQPSIKIMSGSDSDSPLVIDESDAQTTKKKKLKTKREMESVTGARGPGSGVHRSRTIVKPKSEGFPRLDHKAGEKAVVQESGEEKLHQLADVALSSSPVSSPETQETERDVEQAQTLSQKENQSVNTKLAESTEPKWEASEALLQLAKAYGDTTDNSTDGSTSTTPTKELGTMIPLDKTAKNHEIPGKDSGKSEVTDETMPKDGSNKDGKLEELPEPSPVYKKGDTVLAKWADCRSYLAYIIKKEVDDQYQIRYYDGMVKIVKSSFIHPWVGPLPAALKVFKPRSPPKPKQRRRSADTKQSKRQVSKIEQKRKDIGRKRTSSLPSESDKSVRRRSRTISEETPLDIIQYSPNEKVLAKWTDLKWYPATVVKQTDSNHYEVKYQDEMTRTVRDTWLTPWQPPSQNDNVTAPKHDVKSSECKISGQTGSDEVKQRSELQPSDQEKENTIQTETLKERTSRTKETIGVGSSAFQVGETVLARWTDCRSYPATIQKVLDDGKYIVQYYDGMQKELKLDWLKAWNPSDLPPKEKRGRPKRISTETSESTSNEVSDKTSLSSQDNKLGRLLPAPKQPTLPRQVVRGYDAYYARLPPATKDLVVETNLNKFKCRVPGCTKSFRKEPLLRQHHKYYHQQRYKLRDMETPTTVPKRKSSKEDSIPRRRVSADYEAIQRELEQSTESKSPDGGPALRSRGAKPPMDVYKQQQGNISISSVSSMLDSSSGVDEIKASGQESTLAEMQDIQATPVGPKLNKRKRKRQGSDQVLLRSDVSPKEEEIIDVEKPASPDSQGEGKPEPVNEDVIHCTCGMEEEEGFMIQCEGCFTWQHAACIGVDQQKSKNMSKSSSQEKRKKVKSEEKKAESQAAEGNEKIIEEQSTDDTYICWVCKSPDNVRKSKKFLYNNDFLTKGKLPSLSNLDANETGEKKRESTEEENRKSFDIMFMAIHQLMDEVVKMQDTLQGIKQKIKVVSSPGEHPLLKTWKDDTQQDVQKPASPMEINNENTEMEVKIDTTIQKQQNLEQEKPSSSPKQEANMDDKKVPAPRGNDEDSMNVQLAESSVKSSADPSPVSECNNSHSGTPEETTAQTNDRVTKKSKKKTNGVSGRRGRSSSSEMSPDDREVYIHRCREKLLDHILDLEKTLDNRLTRLEDYVSTSYVIGEAYPHFECTKIGVPRKKDIETDEEDGEGHTDIGKLKDDLTAVQKLLLYC